ncbi:MAG: hypothetical protein EOO88_55225 [Pedobacter sp.]|nr:MAG: hypothetical protein EOO88_55225 [Pedobacter sp.]
MANKQYTSIIRLFRHCDIAIEGQFNLSRVKKQLQAEFNIAQGGFIEVEGHTYTRHAVIEEIELPDFEQRLSFHKLIWERPNILSILEQNTGDIAALTDEFRPLWKNAEFDQFLSSYFVGPFNYLSRTLLAKAGFKELAALYAFEPFLMADEREEGLRPVRIFLDDNLRTLRNVTKENYNMMRENIAVWIDAEWNYLFNQLPDEFYERKNDLVDWYHDSPADWLQWLQ